MVYLLLIVSFVILIKGADIFIDGATKIAEIFKIPELIIGIIIAGFGTSSPELAVNLAAVFKGSDSIAVGNVVGSNIFNILLIIGVVAIYKPLKIDRKLATFDFPVAIVAAIILPIFALGGRAMLLNGSLSRTDGILCLLIFSYYVKETIKKSYRDQKLQERKMFIYNVVMGHHDPNAVEEKEVIKKRHIFKDIMFIVVGLGAVVKGGDMVVQYASEIAISLGMTTHLVGLTIVGIGTSLPELVVSVIAARKGQQDIILGNIIGSNTFNILLVLGLTMTIKPIATNVNIIYDSLTVAAITVGVGALAILKREISRMPGAIFVGLYVLYMGQLIYSS